MHWIDGHLDLAYLAVNGRDVRREVSDPKTGCVSLPALRRAIIDLVFATIFTEPCDGEPDAPEKYRRDDPESAHAAGLRQLQVYEQWEREGELKIIRTTADISAQLSPPHPVTVSPGHLVTKSPDRVTPKMILLMEGADPIRSPEDVPFWFDRGLRIVGLTWATGTRYAGGNSSKPGEGALTKLGIELIRALDEAGIVHDVSHLSDAAFDGLMEHARPGSPEERGGGNGGADGRGGPRGGVGAGAAAGAGGVIASHSNCRALVEDKQRHLRDEQIKAIAARDGIIGLNLYTDFLFPRSGPGRAGGRRATIADCIAHLDHVCEIMGHRRGIALGSDMDGGFTPAHLPIGLEGPEKLNALADALSGVGWDDNEIKGFAQGNWLSKVHGWLEIP